MLRCSGAPVAQQSMGAKPRRRTNADLDELQHPLLGDQPTLQLMTPKDATGARLFWPHQCRGSALSSCCIGAPKMPASSHA